jgi:signal transduction histidine kinase
VRVRLASEGGEGRIDVSDNGIGIAPDHHDRIFERFYRVDQARSRELGGTGLGLSIVKHVCMAHRGTVSLESALGVGSTFRVRLPLA